MDSKINITVNRYGVYDEVKKDKNKRLFYLDFIRVISMILIVIFHFKGSLAVFHIEYNFNFVTSVNGIHFGNIGVQLFFLLSGAALMHTYKNHLDIKAYIKKRILSIYPMFWISYIVAFSVLFLINKTVNHVADNWTIMLNIIGMDGYLHYAIQNFYLVGEWFLGCIIILYIVFPFIRFCIEKRPVISFATFTVMYIFIVTFYNFNMSIEGNALVRVYDFILGMYIVKYVKFPTMKGVIISCIIGGLFLMLDSMIPHTYRITMIGVSLFYILMYCSKLVPEGMQYTFNKLSRHSYAVFLVHHIIIVQLTKLFEDRTLSFVEIGSLFFIICIFIAVISKFILNVTNQIIDAIVTKDIRHIENKKTD